MTRALLLAAVVACAVVVPAASAPQAEPRFAGPPAVLTQYGYVRSLVRAEGGYRMRFDPALWLTGETANRAAREDGILGPGESVPNDYYIRNESRRPLTYRVLRTARVTVLARRGGEPRATRISVARLVTVARGGSIGVPLYGRGLGYWARIEGDTVVRLDQQYQP